MNLTEKIDAYINTHPRESLQLVVIACFLFWQSVAALIGLLLYVVLSKKLNIAWWVILSLGIVLVCSSILAQDNFLTFKTGVYLRQGFKFNFLFWQFIAKDKVINAVNFIINDDFHYIMGVPLFMAGLLALGDLVSSHPYENKIRALMKGEAVKPVEIKEKIVQKALDRLNGDDFGGTALGVSRYTGKHVIVPDHYVNQVVLVLGTTGGGKTITLKRFYDRAVIKGYPLVIVDGKPDEDNILWLKKLAEKHNRRFIGFNSANYCHYDPLAEGGFTELKDKIISLKDQWENDYYRSIAEDYLQTTFEALLKTSKRFDLKRVADCLDHGKLSSLRGFDDEKLIKRIEKLGSYDQKDITGLQAHLHLLIHSELGQYFENNETTFNLTNAIKENAIVYFALPALRFPTFSKVLGKLVINDIKAVIDRLGGKSRPIFTVFDEFSVFAGEQVLNLVNMGRGKGLHAVFGTQGLADLEKVDPAFKDQLLNCANTLICHRLNDQNSAEGIANWIGTKDIFTLTAQMNLKEQGGGLGSVRHSKEYIVHPDDIKQGLRTGEAFYVTKVASFVHDKVQIKFSVG